MDRVLALQLLQNLLERAKETGEKTFLTSREIKALEVTLEDAVSEEGNVVSLPVRPPQSSKIVQQVELARDDIQADIMLCVDFGTSFSKAFACIDNGNTVPDIIDLPIGEHGKSINPLVTPSEMLIDDQTIYFGGAARKLFDDSEAPADRLIDSIKQYMTLGTDVSNLAKIRLDTAKDPHQKFYQRDVLVLYLAHLMRLTERALETKGYSVNVPRRFAHPAWSDKNSEKNQEEMKMMMAQAVILSRSLGDELLDGILVSKARLALDQLKGISCDLALTLIAEPVREATAAGAGALLGAAEHKREAYIIVDIGAGTTDVAGCYCVNNPAWERPRVFEITGAANAIKSAGNVLDNALTGFVLNKLNAIPGSAEHRATAAFMNRNKRLYKERLFEAGKVLIELPTGEAIEVELGEFTKSGPVVAFTNSVKAIISNAAITVAGDASRISFVATGGGARLPMIRQIADDGVQSEGKHVAFSWREPAPDGMNAAYPDLIDPYPQIAVAVGGALPALPEQRAAISSGLFDAPKRYMGPSYKS